MSFEVAKLSFKKTISELEHTPIPTQKELQSKIFQTIQLEMKSLVEKPESTLQYLKLLARFPEVSIQNSLLLLHQNPNISGFQKKSASTSWQMQPEILFYLLQKWNKKWYAVPYAETTQIHEEKPCQETKSFRELIQIVQEKTPCKIHATEDSNIKYQYDREKDSIYLNRNCMQSEKKMLIYLFGGIILKVLIQNKNSNPNRLEPFVKYLVFRKLEIQISYQLQKSLHWHAADLKGLEATLQDIRKTAESVIKILEK